MRARHLLARRLGSGRARTLADAPSLEGALATLEGTAYGRDLSPGMGLAEAQHSLAETVLWHLRVLSGWVPASAVEPLRALAAWFELVNIEERVGYLMGGELRSPFELGGLATAWPRVAAVQTVSEMRSALAGSDWGHPGHETGAWGSALRLAWARRVLKGIEEAGEWAAGAVALLLARELTLADGRVEDLVALRPPGVGRSWSTATTVAALRALLPVEAGWPLVGIGEPDELWRAEATWWRRVEDDAERLSAFAHLGRPTVLGTAVLLGVDAWRTAGALEVAARGGARGSREVFAQIV